MRQLPRSLLGLACAAVPVLLAPRAPAQEAATPGERVPAAAISPLVLESMDQVRAREASIPRHEGPVWNGQDGRWFVPPESAKTPAHSGEMAIVNEWGDLRMGIGFPGLVDLSEVWVAGHGVAPARAVRFVGFRGETEVKRTEWLSLGATHQKVALDLAAIDRLEVQSVPFFERFGFVALDDLRLAPAGKPEAVRTLDFEDLSFRQVLTKTDYAGLTWESGSGFRSELDEAQIVPAPQGPPADTIEVAAGGDAGPLNANDATTPATWDDFVGVTQGDPGATLVPPDTCGANGPDHYVAIVNANLSAWTKAAQQRVVNVSLGAFWNVSGLIGDPRIVYDPHAQRFVALATDFSGGRTIYLAVSQSTDPAGSWYKFSFRVDQGTDVGRWPDYPTLGVDARGIYTAAYMVTGSARMTIWAIDKAPLLANPPSVGTITAFRSLPWEGAIQPCTTYGDPGGEYLVSRRSSTALRLRRIDPPMTAPTLVEVGSVTVPSHSSPPSAPALGSTTPISTIDYRPMNAVFRNGSVWTTHCISFNSRAACRWYELATSPVGLAQYGTIADTLWHYYYPSISADRHGNVGIGFSGSHAGVYCSTFLSGRRASDPPGLMAAPILIKAGEASWNRLDSSSRNRFGDYSHTDVDSVDDLGFWTTQEYIYQTNVWRTRVTRLGFEAVAYGDGLAGKNGVPFLRTAARPVIGQTVTFQLENSSGNATAGLFVLGLQAASVPVLGGTLLVSPLVILNVPIPATQADVGLPFPNDTGLVGNPLFFQSVQLDVAAAQSFAFSRGLEVRASSR